MADDDDNYVQLEADSIATKIMNCLIDKFKEKTGNDPTPEEVEHLLSELTEDRINKLLTGEDFDDEDGEDGDEELDAESHGMNQGNDQAVEESEENKRKSSKDLSDNEETSHKKSKSESGLDESLLN
jgi:hypothetical protein